MPPEAVLALAAPAPTPPTRLRVADVALFYGERSGGIRTYLEAKAAFARRTGRFEHHLVIPGRAQDAGDAHRHLQPSLRLAASNGYRVPLGSAPMQATLRELAPDVVMLHDPYWAPRLTSREAHSIGAAVIAVHHSSPALHAAGLPGPQVVYERALRRWYRRAYLEVDAVMSVVDPSVDAHRNSEITLRLGLDAAFRPQPGIARADHVLYAGRLAREKGLRELLEAVALGREEWTLRIIGTGPAGDLLADRARHLGIAHRVRFLPYLSSREALAREFAEAGCVVLPGPHETFGLAALEAAACGAPVVTAEATPSAALLDGFVETFPAGDAHSLARAIDRARTRRPDPRAATELTRCHGWDAALHAELDDLERLLERS